MYKIKKEEKLLKSLKQFFCARIDNMKKGILFYLTLFLLILAFSTAANYFDFDIWARLIAGMGVVDGGSVLKADFLSYTPVHTWWDHEWGSGVIFYLILKYLGPYYLIILQAILMFLIFFTASKIIKLRTNYNPYNILFYFFTIMSVMPNLNNPVRCHMFSFLLFTVFIYILEKVRRGNNKLLFLIPVLTIFWNNVHGGVVSGLGLLLMYAVGEFLNKKNFLKLITVFLISSAALIINPWGIEYIKFLLMANTMERTHIVEWWGLFAKYNLLKYIIFKLFMLSILLTETLSIFKSIKLNGIKDWYKQADKVKYIVLLSTLYLAIIHVKLMPFFAIASICFAYEDFYKLTENLKLPVWKDKFIYAALLFISIFTFVAKDFSLPVGIGTYPVKEVEFIRKNNLKGNILVNFGLGSYVAYKLYPNNKIFMDGRYEEVYFDYMIPMLKEFCLGYPHWREILTYFPPDIIIIEKYYPIFNILQKESEWTLVYQDKLFGVFLPKSKASNNYILPTDDINYYKNTLFTTGIKFKK